MSDHRHVRVHLRQVILVGHDNKARYAKVLTGIRQSGLDERFENGEQLVAVDVYGSVTGSTNNFRTTSIEPHTHLLAGSNILSIEDMSFSPDQHFADCPPRESGCRCPMQERPAQNQACTSRARHAAHSYHNPRAMIECPGFPGN